MLEEREDKKELCLALFGGPIETLAEALVQQMNFGNTLCHTPGYKFRGVISVCANIGAFH
jgi:hypothetical protein